MKTVLHYFEEISKIPHISFHEKELSDYCVAFAKERGLECYQDEMYNVVIIKEATEGYEDVPPIMIQGHLDMVGDKMADCTIDMEKEPIRLMTEGDYLTADGTTLGGDDGIAVAYALAILDADTLAHPRVEVVLTVSEEVGLLGATGIDLSMCKGRRLINIDSEEEGIITAGCAGGVRALCEVPLWREHREGICCELSLSGLLGGHSGIAIGLGRANGNLLLGRFLLQLKEKISYNLDRMYGGVKDNVIPKEAVAEIIVNEEDYSMLEAQADIFNQHMKAEYGVTDPDIRLSVAKKDAGVYFPLTTVEQEKVLTLLNLMPNGVQTMSADIEGLVETSLNMGVVKLQGERLELDFALRSSVPSAKEMLVRKVCQLTSAFEGKTTLHGDYPAWVYDRESKFRELCMDIYKEMYGVEAKVEIIHAGLECGILSNKIPGLECISIGPNMYDVHTPYERISISSVARVWEYLKRILANKN